MLEIKCRKYVQRSTESARTPLKFPVMVRRFVSGRGGGGGELNRAGETISRYSILTFLLFFLYIYWESALSLFTPARR